MKKHMALVFFFILCKTVTLAHEMNIQLQGPMDSVWFYDKNNIFVKANKYHQKQQWEQATKSYKNTLQEKTTLENISSYDKHKAQLNLAACLMAQRKATKHWASFDMLLNIAEQRRISSDIIDNAAQDKETKTVLIRTDQIGIGDIFCFLSAAHILKDRTRWNIILSVRNFLKKTFENTATQYNFKLIDEDETIPIINYETHLIALLGHLKLTPAQINPEKVMFTAPEQAILKVLEQVMPILVNDNILVIADRGEVNRQATLIGGKQLPNNPHNHGRHLDSEPFNALLEKYPNVILMDCGNEKNRIIVDNEYQQRYITIAPEQQPFDTIIALARIMSTQKNIIGFGPDMGQTNVFARCLEYEAQNRMAFIIPNSQENDMRMEGEGYKYKHMISNCWVYKCDTPNDQTKTIEAAYLDMLKY